jgi:hypothetical protein
MISLAVLAIMAGCAVFLFLKGTLAQGIMMVLNALIAGFVAFGFYEMLAGYVIKYSPGITAWAHLIGFLVLFLLTFAVLQAVAMQINKEKIDFGKLAEQIGRPVAGVVLGYIVTGHLLVGAALAPIPSQYPYPRFDERNPNPANPNRPLLSPDGFAAGLFGMVSSGSFSPFGEPKSFAVLHAGYVDQLYLNRPKGSEVPVMTSTQAIDVPRKSGVWEASDGLRDTEGKPVPAQAGRHLMLVRVVIRTGAMKDASKFTLSQFRLICGPRAAVASPLAGGGEAVYPIGYIGAGGRLETKSLAEVIAVDTAKVASEGATIDLAFQVPTNLVPVLLGFKRNNLVRVSSPASVEDAPQPVPFGAAPPRVQQQPETADDQVEEPEQEAAPSNGQRRRRGLSDTSRSIIGDLDE